MSSANIRYYNKVNPRNAVFTLPKMWVNKYATPEQERLAVVLDLSQDKSIEIKPHQRDNSLGEGQYLFNINCEQPQIRIPSWWTKSKKLTAKRIEFVMNVGDTIKLNIKK